MSATMPSPDRWREDVSRLQPWFHNLHLPDGTHTAPDHRFGDFPHFKWLQVRDTLPPRLDGVRVLDIGCNAGFYSFELARLGAEVLGIDHDEHYLRQAEWARGIYGLSNVRFAKMQVYELARLNESFDLILFMGVLYHLRYPLLALDIVAGFRPERMLFQTLTFGDDTVAPAEPGERVDFPDRDRLGRPDWPHLAFVEGTFADDPTNWWVANHAAVYALLRSAGFEVVSRPGHEIYACRWNGGISRVPVDTDALASVVSMHRQPTAQGTE